MANLPEYVWQLIEMIREIKVESEFPALATTQIPFAFYRKSKAQINNNNIITRHAIESSRFESIQNNITILFGWANEKCFQMPTHELTWYRMYDRLIC